MMYGDNLTIQAVRVSDNQSTIMILQPMSESQLIVYKITKKLHVDVDDFEEY